MELCFAVHTQMIDWQTFGFMEKVIFIWLLLHFFYGKSFKQKVLKEMKRVNSGIYNINVDINYSIFDETVENMEIGYID